MVRIRTKVLTLLVTRKMDSKEEIVAAGSYFARNDKTAEVAFAVEDRLQGKGIGAQLLERLGIVCRRHGFTRFWAVTRMENESMIEVFRHSGFPMTERLDRGIVEIDFAVVPTESSVKLFGTA